MKKAAVINDLSGFGKCSLTAAIPVLSALGIQCVPLATAVLTGQTGYHYYHCTDLTEMIPQYIDAWQKNHAHFDAICTGFLTGPKQISYVQDFIDVFYEKNTLLLVDPVMGDDGQVFGMYSDEFLREMKCLTRKADIITPNLTEACLLADVDVRELLELAPSLGGCASPAPSAEPLLDAVLDVAGKLRMAAQREQDVIITGIKFPDPHMPSIYNVAVDRWASCAVRSHFFNRSFSGTGDLFAAALCGLKLKGYATKEALSIIRRFLHNSISDTLRDDISRNDGIHFEPHLKELTE